jgi:hypothetical protein
VLAHFIPPRWWFILIVFLTTHANMLGSINGDPCSLLRCVFFTMREMKRIRDISLSRVGFPHKQPLASFFSSDETVVSQTGCGNRSLDICCEIVEQFSRGLRYRVYPGCNFFF